MTLDQIKAAIQALDPYTIARADLDNFSPYMWLEYPAHIDRAIDALSDEDQEVFRNWEHDYMDELRG